MRPGTVLAAAAGVALVGGGLVQAGPGLSWFRGLRGQLVPRLSGLGRRGHLALTFDDGPDPNGTPAMLEALSGLGWRATFFMLGVQVRRHPQLAAEVAAAGHEVAVHGDRHRYLLARTPADTFRDLVAARDSVAAATGQHPRWYRPPYGVLTAGALLAARRLDLSPVLWSAWGKDWTVTASPRSVLTEVGKGRLDGGTLLLHDSDLTSAAGSWRTTQQSLALLAGLCARQGLQVGPLGSHFDSGTSIPEAGAGVAAWP